MDSFFSDFFQDTDIYSKDELTTLQSLEHTFQKLDISDDHQRQVLVEALKIVTDRPVLSPDVSSLILSREKRFVGILKDPELNQRGLHLFRIVFAHYMETKRIARVPEPTIDTGLNIDTYRSHGIALIHDFLGMASAQEIKREIQDFPISVHKTPDNIVGRHQATHPNLAALLTRSKLPFIISHAFGTTVHDPEFLDLYGNNTFVQRVLNRPNEEDRQKLFHSDTFFSAIKFWYFPEEVTLSAGPLWYVPNSFLPGANRLSWEYAEANKVALNSFEAWRDRDHAEGSFRINERELEDLDCQAKPMVVPADTLVVTNVRGFHKRGDAMAETTRNAVHGSLRRADPFH